MPFPMRFTRRQYVWASILLFAVAPILEVIALLIFPAFESVAKPLNTAIFIMIALTTGARLRDAGYRAWVGVTVVFAIGVGIPVVAGAGYVFFFRGTRDQFLIFAGAMVVVAMLLLLAFAVWVATRKSVPSNDDFDEISDDGAVLRNRIEPRF